MTLRAALEVPSWDYVVAAAFTVIGSAPASPGRRRSVGFSAGTDRLPENR